MHVNMVVYLKEKLNQLLHKKRLLHEREVFIRFFHSYRELYPFLRTESYNPGFKRK